MIDPRHCLPPRGLVRSPRVVGYCLALALLAHVSPALAQFKLQEAFTGTTAPGWTLSGNALLTAPSIDTAGQGWLRLSDTGNNEKGLALDTAQSFPGNVPVTVRFSYVSWGGSGADGITMFLYDSTQDMSGATTGGGLGYCGGAGGFLAVALDEYGNFSNPGDKCGAASGGPGNVPDSLVLRGPVSANDQYVTGLPIAGGIDSPGAGARPTPKTVLVTLTPAATGYTVTAQLQNGSGQPFQSLFANVAFPYTAPASLSVGFSGSTGGSTNYHELQGLVAATPDDLQVTMSGPATVLQGTPVSYTLTVTNSGAYPIAAADAPLVTDSVPAAISGVSWTCAAAGGASCTASGSGNLSTSGLTPAVQCFGHLHDHRHAPAGDALWRDVDQFRECRLRQRIDLPRPGRDQQRRLGRLDRQLRRHPGGQPRDPDLRADDGRRAQCLADHRRHRNQRRADQQHRHHRKFLADQRLQPAPPGDQLQHRGHLHSRKRRQPERQRGDHQQRIRYAHDRDAERHGHQCRPG